MSKKLTDSTIESNTKTEEIINKSVLDVNTFVDNVNKLKSHFDNIEEIRKNIKIEADAEKEMLNEANSNLKAIKENKISDYEELKEQFNK
jgi:hypothetical protein